MKFFGMQQFQQKQRTFNVQSLTKKNDVMILRHNDVTGRVAIVIIFSSCINISEQYNVAPVDGPNSLCPIVSFSEQRIANITYIETEIRPLLCIYNVPAFEDYKAVCTRKYRPLQ